MNILLIHPYINSSTPALYLNEPLGLICLATYLKSNETSYVRNINILDLYALGHNVIRKEGKYYNIGVSDPETIVKKVKEYSPDIIGITCNFTTYTKAVFDIANLLKMHFPEVLLVIGGAHATMDAEGVLKQCEADVVIRGEGELTFNELVERIENKQGFYDIVGITYRHDGAVISNPHRALMPDINILPIPDRRYIQQDVYCKVNGKMYFLSKGRKVASIITSRGCPFNCVFCSTKVVWERKFRSRSPELVIQEMEQLVTNYGIDEFLINDDQFYLSKERVDKICDMIIERKFNIALNVASGSSVWLLDVKLLKKLQRAGLYRITFPIESGSEKTIKYIRKPINLKKTKELIKLANSLGIWTYANFIVGFPYETHEDIQETIDYAFKTGLDNATFFIAKPYAGSEMYEDFKKEGLLDGDVYAPTTMGEVGNRIVHLSAKELQKIRNKAQKRYFLGVLSNYLNPFFFFKYVYPKINSFDGLKYFIKALKNTIRHFIIQPIYQRLALTNNVESWVRKTKP